MGSRLEAKSKEVRKRIEKHTFENEEGEEYESSSFGGFNDYFRRKKIKLQNLDAERRSLTQDNPPIFKGVVAHVNGYTQPSLNDLHTLIVSYGGGFIQYLDGKTMVTHIIASNLTPKKKVEFAKYRIVKPAWVLDSIKAGRLLSWDAYRVVDESIGQRVLGFEHGGVVSQVNSRAGGYKDQTDTSWYTSQVREVAESLSLQHPGSPAQIPKADHIESDGDSEFSGKEALARSLSQDDTEQAYDQDVAVDESTLEEHPDGTAIIHRNEHGRLDDRLDSLPIPMMSTSVSGAFTIAQNSAVEHPPVDLAKEFSPISRTTSNSENQQFMKHLLNPDDNSEKHASNDALHSLKNNHERPSNDLQPTSNVIEFETDNGNKIAQKVTTSPSKIEDMTPEEHNALLLADPKVWKSTVVNPGFLKQYYEESRLHHLSAWKASLKAQLQALASEKSASQKQREKRIPGKQRYILHVDFDSFFAAVSLKKFPQLVENPVVVAHGNGSGAEIASCNYPARKFGIKNGMWMKHAQKLCPQVKVLPYDFKAYEEVSRSFYEAIIGTGGLVQSVSIDEALVDISAQCITAGRHDGKGVHEGSIWREQEKADNIAQGLRDLISEKTGCAVSVGIGGNILLAKVALRKAKPAGQHHIKPEEALDFLGELTMQDLPGVAYSIGGRLEEVGVKYVKDVRQLSKERMISVLGPKTGEKIWDYSRGVDRAEVGDQAVRKSVSAEVNWGIRFVTQEQADEFIQSLADELHKRLLTEGVKGRQLTMKIMRRAPDAPLDPPKHLGHGKCDTFNKSLVLSIATNDPTVLGREALSVLKGFGFSPGELRGLGIQMQKLEPIDSTNTLSGSSQKILQFKTTTPQKPTLRKDSVTDDIESPQRSTETLTPNPSVAFARPASPGGKSASRLNTLGTQFVLPTQVDQEVLKELPNDIRSNLLPKRSRQDFNEGHNSKRESKSRSTTPTPASDTLANYSQLDQETLDALPSDVRSEVLAQYANLPHKIHGQAILPQSPRKERSLQLPKKLTTPTKRRGRPLGGGVSRKAKISTHSSLTQSNFVANAKASSSKTTLNTPADSTSADEISAEFLSEIPEEIRREILDQARRERLQKKGGINLTAKRKRAAASKSGPSVQRTLALPPRPPKPTFTAQKLAKLPELREAMTAWYDEFSDEGPYQEDVDVLVDYLHKVVTNECDMDKAVSVAKWLQWVIDEGGSSRDMRWIDALGKIRQGLQESIRDRGLGQIEL